jgi:uncharacterized protein (TIGR02266 family)
MTQSGPPQPPETSDRDRRRDERIPARVEVRFEEVAPAMRALRVFSTNVSSGGICLRTQATYPVGHRLALHLAIAGQGLDLTAEVCWVRPEAVGLRFVEVSEANRGVLAGLLDSLRSDVP